MRVWKAKVCEYTYFIQAGNNGPVKIGQADCPGRRMQQLQIGNHEHLSLIGVTDINEEQLHGEFSELRIRGEWFRPEEYFLDWIAENSWLWVPTCTRLSYMSLLRVELREHFRRIITIEPKITRVLDEALSYRSSTRARSERDKPFCANEVWYHGIGKRSSLKSKLCCLVGWSADRLKSEADYDVAYDVISNALPDCRGCGCMTVSDLRNGIL